LINPPIRRRVARALRPGGPDVIEVGIEDLTPLKAGETLVEVAAAGLNHAETLIRSGSYAVRLPFPHAVGGEGAGTVVAAGPDVSLPVGTRVCWAAVLGSCATHVIAPAFLLAPIPDDLSFEDGACLAVAGLTAGGLVRVWPVKDGAAVVWGAAGVVGRMLVALLTEREVNVIGIASGSRMDAVRAAGATHVIDRASQDVEAAVREYTAGRGATVVFDPIGAGTFETSLQLLAPRGCLINYGELSGPVPSLNLHRLFPNSIFVTKYNGMHWVKGLPEFASLISSALALAQKRRAVISDIAGRFPLNRIVDAYQALDAGAPGKVLVLPAENRVLTGTSLA
jgi:NADPH2:quinone reductase